MSAAEIKELKKELSSVIRETIQLEMMKFRAELIPCISEDEQTEIENMYNKPSKEAVKSKKIKI
jgi:hypothetical protein